MKILIIIIHLLVIGSSFSCDELTDLLSNTDKLEDALNRASELIKNGAQISYRGDHITISNMNERKFDDLVASLHTTYSSLTPSQRSQFQKELDRVSEQKATSKKHNESIIDEFLGDLAPPKFINQQKTKIEDGNYRWVRINNDLLYFFATYFKQNLVVNEYYRYDPKNGLIHIDTETVSFKKLGRNIHTRRKAKTSQAIHSNNGPSYVVSTKLNFNLNKYNPSSRGPYPYKKHSITSYTVFSEEGIKTLMIEGFSIMNPTLKIINPKVDKDGDLILVGHFDDDEESVFSVIRATPEGHQVIGKMDLSHALETKGHGELANLVNIEIVRNPNNWSEPLALDSLAPYFLNRTIFSFHF